MPSAGWGQEWLTVRDAARLAGVDDSTIRRWCASGRLAHRRTPGNHRRIARGDLDNLLVPDAASVRVPDSVPATLEVWAGIAEAIWAEWDPDGWRRRDEAEAVLAVLAPEQGTGLVAVLGSLADRVRAELDSVAATPAAEGPAESEASWFHGRSVSDGRYGGDR